MRHLFWGIGVPLWLLSAWWAYNQTSPFTVGLLLVLSFLLLIGLRDVGSRQHAILRNFPLLGHLRYFFEFISPEIQQYFIERHTDGRPFSRNERSLVYQRAKNISATHPFGTQLDINAANYEGLKHSIYPAPVLETAPRVRIGGASCGQPYEASLLNISAMSFGALSQQAIKALNLGAQRGGFYHNTGEGGLSDHHRQGGDLVWQIGTGYFGCRTEDGHFDLDSFEQKARLPEVKMIEIKISQGAKPGHGGVLPAVKNTEEIARIRGLKPHTTVLSPPQHSAFHDPDSLLDFVQLLREHSGGKPVGFKLCIGRTDEFMAICEAMKARGTLVDFITVDGAEGGTGAAPLEFTDMVGMPLEPALIFVNRTLLHYGLRSQIRVIASGKVMSGFALLKNLALGADLCNSARGFMFSLGCIQALRCDTNKCPTGVATQDRMLMKGLVVEDKKDRVYHYQKNTVKAALELLAASGARNLDELDMQRFMRGDEFSRLEDRYFPDNLKSVMQGS